MPSMGWLRCGKSSEKLCSEEDGQQLLIPGRKDSYDKRDGSTVVKSGLLGVSPVDVFQAERKSRTEQLSPLVKSPTAGILSPTTSMAPTLVAVASHGETRMLSPTVLHRKEGGLPAPRRSESGRFQPRKYSTNISPPRKSSMDTAAMPSPRRSKESRSKMTAAANMSGKAPAPRRSIVIPPRLGNGGSASLQPQLQQLQSPQGYFSPTTASSPTTSAIKEPRQSSTSNSASENRNQHVPITSSTNATTANTSHIRRTSSTPPHTHSSECGTITRSNILRLYFDGSASRNPSPRTSTSSKRTGVASRGPRSAASSNNLPFNYSETDDDSELEPVKEPTAKTMNKLLGGWLNLPESAISIYSEACTDIPDVKHKATAADGVTEATTRTSSHWSLSSSQTDNTTAISAPRAIGRIQPILGVTKDSNVWKAVSKAGDGRSIKKKLNETQTLEENYGTDSDDNNDYNSVCYNTPSTINSYLGQESYIASESETENEEAGYEKKIFQVRVVHEYRAELEDELSLCDGDVVDVVEFFDDGWACGLIGGVKGAFLLACVAPLEEVDDGKEHGRVSMVDSVMQRSSSLGGSLTKIHF
ncbi:UNVERIFIED_CONTAM: hypothetical protein HDU68_007324 [Siphonaria sp. JEL0065]|nr:hypothetical protein HDU68_007324 [Siphonaria sp. JEL0065]